MPVSSETSRSEYTGNGVTVAFPTGFKFLENEHVQVYSAAEDTDDWEEVSSDLYTLTGADDEDGGTVTYHVAPVSGLQIRVQRTVPLTQLLELTSLGTFTAASLTDALDLLTMEAQQLERDTPTVADFEAHEASVDADLASFLATVDAGLTSVADGLSTLSTSVDAAIAAATALAARVTALEAGTGLTFTNIASLAAFVIQPVDGAPLLQELSNAGWGHLRGSIFASSPRGAGQPLFTTTVFPANACRFAVPMHDGSTHTSGVINIAVNGLVTVLSANAPTRVYLDGIRYRVA